MCFIPMNVHDRTITVQWCSSAQIEATFAYALR